MLMSTRPPRATDNPYLLQLYDGVAGKVVVRHFSPRSALRRLPDLIHVHWPHELVRGRTPLRSLVRAAGSAVLLARARRAGVPVVQTVHNTTPHESASRLEQRVLDAFDAMTWLRVYLNESPENDLSRGVVVLHPDYREWLARHGVVAAPPRTAPGPEGWQLLVFGLLRSYKGIETLTDLVAGQEGDATPVHLTVAGRPLDPGYGAELEGRHPGSPHISWRFGHLAENELAAAVLATDLVVLPYRRMENSGAALYALSLGRPVLLPWTPPNAALAEEVGPGWVTLFRGELHRPDLDRALDAARAGSPDLSRRSPDVSGRLHASLYRSLVAYRRAGESADGARESVLRDPEFARHSRLNQSGSRMGQ